MTRVIAFCTDAPVFNGNGILDEALAKKYPGSLWVQRLSRLVSESGAELVTGDIAIQNVQNAKWKAKDILVIQEECAAHAERLLELGAFPFVLLSLESPLYASKFYANLADIAAKFENRILFRGVFGETSKAGENHTAYFPCFSQEYSNGSLAPSWESRKYLVMVAANKYWAIKRSKVRQAMAWTRDFLLRRKSYLTEDITNKQLHNKRLELIEYFGLRGNFDLFGMYWNDIGNLPDGWRSRLATVIKKLDPPPCEDKKEIISQYKFAICLENMTYPGYVTEKIIDCFVAEVIPVYSGAPDISDFVPNGAFVNLNDFESLHDLNAYLKNMTQESALKILQCGQDFLNSEEGQRHSFEGFSRSVMNMTRKHW